MTQTKKNELNDRILLRGIGCVLIGLSAFTMLQNIQVREEQALVLECQAAFTEQFTEALRSRGAANAEDQTAIDTLVGTLITNFEDPESTSDDLRRALYDYAETRQRTDEHRAANPYPETTLSEECKP